jgi:DNA-binding CsgD family transcriptional regulator/PAS domain-containing protein
MLSRDREALILQAIRGLYDAVLDPDQGSRGFEALCRVVDGKHFIFFTEDIQAHRLQHFTSLGVGPDYARRLAMAVDARLHSPSRLAMSPGCVKPGQSLWLDQPYRDSAYYNEVVRPDGGYDGLIAVPFRKARHSAFLVIGRMQGQPDFEDADARLIQPVMSHLTNATQIRLRLEQAEFAARQAHRAFDLLDIGVFILDAELRPSFLNKRAEALVRASDGLCFSRGALSTAAAPTTRILRRAVKNAIDLQGHRGRIELDEVHDAIPELEISRPSGRPALISTVMPLGVENSERFLMPPAHAIMFVKQPDEKPRLDLGRLANVFGLSPRQAALTSLLAQGATLADAAAALGIGFETARWHLRTTFDKTGTHRQVDLVRLVLQTMASPSAVS